MHNNEELQIMDLTRWECDVISGISYLRIKNDALAIFIALDRVVQVLMFLYTFRIL